MEGMILRGPYLLNCDSYRSLIIPQSMEGRIAKGPYHLDCDSYRSQISQLGHVAAAWKRSHQWCVSLTPKYQNNWKNEMSSFPVTN